MRGMVTALIAAALAVGTTVPGRAATGLATEAQAKAATARAAAEQAAEGRAATAPSGMKEGMAATAREDQDVTPGDGSFVEIHSYMVRKAQEAPGADMQQLVALTDIRLLNKKMTSDEMSDYIKATRWQAKMVYFYSRLTGNDRDASGKEVGGESTQGVSLMTPLEFVHSLADDLFSRKALQPLVNRKQKEGLLIRRDIMDWAARSATFSEERLEEIIAEYISKTY